MQRFAVSRSIECEGGIIRRNERQRNVQAIETKYLGATNYKGSRIKATHQGNVKSVTVGYDHALNLDENHQRAAKTLLDKLGTAGAWDGKMVGGSTRNGMAWVFVEDSLSINASLPIMNGSNGRPLPFQI